jgi:putative ABC transport system permease protein
MTSYTPASNPTYTINYNYLYLIGAIGLFLILAACVNYTNLSTALAIRKSKEVGVRKTMGATRYQLIRQFFAETFLMTALVILCAALSVRLFIPLLNTLLDKNIPLNWVNAQSLALLTALWIGVSLFAGYTRPSSSPDSTPSLPSRARSPHPAHPFFY